MADKNNQPDPKQAADLLKRQKAAQALWDDLESTAESLEELAKNPKQGNTDDDRWDALEKAAAQLQELAGKISAVEGAQQEELLVLYRRAQMAYKALNNTRAGSDEDIQAFKDKLREAKERTDDALPMYKRAEFFIKKNRGTSGVFSTRKWMSNAAGFTGKKELLAGFIEKLKQAPGKAYAKTVDKSLQLAEGNKLATKVIKSVDNVARTVKLVGTESLGWLGKKMKDLSFMLWRFIKTPIQWLGKGAGLLATLFPLAMLYPYIKTALKEVDKVLREKYGDNYVKAILKELWDKSLAKLKDTWEWLKDVGPKIGAKVKEYLLELWDKLKVTLSDSFTGVQKFFGEKIDYVTGLIGRVVKFLLPGATKSNDAAGNMQVTPEGAYGTYGTPESNTPKTHTQVVADKLNAYREKPKGAARARARVEIQNLLDSQVPAKSLLPVLVTRLRNEGFNVSDDKVIATPSADGATPVLSQERGAAPTAGAAPQVSRAVPLLAGVAPSTAGAGRGSVNPPTAGAPVVATPPSAATEESRNTNSENPVKQNVTGGVPLSAIPTVAGEDTLAVLNQGWSTA